MHDDGVDAGIAHHNLHGRPCGRVTFICGDNILMQDAFDLRQRLDQAEGRFGGLLLACATVVAWLHGALVLQRSACMNAQAFRN